MLERVINKNKKNMIILSLYTPWCSRCKALEHALLQKKINNIYKIDIDAEPFIDYDLFQSINSLPCIWIYKNGSRFEMNNPSIKTIEDYIINPTKCIN